MIHAIEIRPSMQYNCWNYPPKEIKVSHVLLRRKYDSFHALTRIFKLPKIGVEYIPFPSAYPMLLNNYNPFKEFAGSNPWKKNMCTSVSPLHASCFHNTELRSN